MLGRYGEGSLVQVDFLATPEEADALRGQLEPAIRPHVQDFQVYAPSLAVSGETARGTLEQICESGGREKPGGALPLLWADNIDRLARRDPQPQAWTIEFVWNNGGGDNNAFAQSFPGPSGRDDLKTVFAKLCADDLDGMVYGLRISAGEPAMVSGPAEAVSALADAVGGHGDNDLASAIRSIGQAHAARTP